MPFQLVALVLFWYSGVIPNLAPIAITKPDPSRASLANYIGAVLLQWRYT